MSGTRHLFLIWLALMLLLAATVAASFVLHGPISLVTGLLIATTKAALIYWIFMHLKEASGLVRVFALGGIVWLSIMLTLMSSDYLTRVAG